MKDKKKPAPSRTGKQVPETVGKVLGDTSLPGKPESPGDWKQKFKKREDILKYLKTSERYWYSKEGFGSEKRQTPA
jgi:hypothetical protein